MYNPYILPLSYSDVQILKFSSKNLKRMSNINNRQKNIGRTQIECALKSYICEGETIYGFAIISEKPNKRGIYVLFEKGIKKSFFVPSNVFF